LPPKQPSALSLNLWDFRFKVRRMKMAFSRLRLGERGKQAIARLLSVNELPFDVLGIRFEAAYTNRKEIIALQNPTEDYKFQVIAERSFAIPGINRFVNIALRPYTSTEEVNRAHEHVVEIVKKRYANMNPSQVDKGEVQLGNIPHVRLVESVGEYMGDNFRVESYACTIGREMLLVEFQCTASSKWDESDCAMVLQLQLDKIEHTPRANGTSK